MKAGISMLVLVLVICLTGALRLHGQGTIQITFDGPPNIPAGSAGVATNYEEAGMSFNTLPAAVGFIRVGSHPRAERPDDGSAYIQQTSGPTAAVLFSFENGSPFGLVSVDLAEYSTVAPDPVTVQFVGYYLDGSTVTTSFTTDGIIDGTGPLADFQTFYFSKDWSGLSKVEIPPSIWSLDNLVVSVPEPGAGALSLVGGAAFWLFARRRRQHEK